MKEEERERERKQIGPGREGGGQAEKDETTAENCTEAQLKMEPPLLEVLEGGQVGSDGGEEERRKRKRKEEDEKGKKKKQNYDRSMTQ